MANPRKRTLSKNLSQMKFMKRQSLGTQDDEIDVGGVLTEKWVVPDVPPAPKSSSEGKQIVSFVECEGLDTFGRFSFNGYNKEIERLARSRVDGDGPSMVEPEEDADIPAQEVARRHNMSKRGERKRQRERHFEKILDRKWT